MDDQQTQAHEQAEAAAHQGPAALLESVADKVGLHAGAKAVFGEPVERDGVTVIPVAQVVYGTGGGGGSSADDFGSGAGGGALTRPIGYIELGPAGTVYRPIPHPWQNATLIVSVAFGALLLAKAVSALLRG
jgi:hypothetical protein